MKKQKITLLSILLCAVFAIAAACGALLMPLDGEVASATGAGKNISFVQVEGGASHTLALTGDGEIYSWGSGPAIGRDGEITVPGLVTPAANNALEAGEWFVKIAASLKASAAITNKGRLYVWGSKDFNANGSSPTYSGGPYVVSDITKPICLDYTHTPSEATSPKKVFFTDIAAGDNHMIALATIEGSSTNVLYGWGDNKYRQTGRDFEPVANANETTGGTSWEVAKPNQGDRPMPTFVNSDPITAIFAGGDTSVIVLKSGRVFSFGRNLYTAQGKKGYALGYTDNAHRTQDFVALRKPIYSSPGQSPTDLDTPTPVSQLSLIANFYKHEWANGANIDLKPSELEAKDYYKTSVSTGTLGTLKIEGGAAKYFGFNYNGDFSDATPDSSGNDGALGGIGLTSVAASKISALNTTGENSYIAAAINATTGKIYLWGKGDEVAGGTIPLTTETLSLPYGGFVSSSIEFKAVFAGYNCIYVLDRNGKIYVMGKNDGSKLCNEQGTLNGEAYPIEMDRYIYNIEPKDVEIDGYNKAGDFFQGKNRPTDSSYTNRIVITPDSLYRNADNLDVMQFLPEQSYQTLYGGLITSQQTALRVEVNGQPLSDGSVTVTLAYNAITIVFNHKTRNTGDVIKVSFAVGKFAYKYDIGSTTCTLERAYFFSINVYSLNSAPHMYTRAEGQVDFRDLNPNNTAGNPVLDSTTRVQTGDLATFFTDVDSDTVRFPSDPATPSMPDLARSIQILGDGAEFISAEVINFTSFRITALKTPDFAREFEIKLTVTDGSELVADGKIVVTVNARPTAELKNGGEFAYYSDPDAKPISVERKVYSLDTNRPYYVANLNIGDSFVLGTYNMFTDPAKFTFTQPLRLDKAGVLVTGGSVNAYPDGILKAVTVSANGKEITFEAGMAGYVDYVVRIEGTSQDLYYIFRFFVTEISAPLLSAAKKADTISAKKDYYLHDHKNENGTITEGLYSNYARNTLVLLDIRYKEEFAYVDWAVNRNSFTVQPKQNGNFVLYFVVTDSRDSNIFASGEIQFFIENYYITETVTVTSGGAMKPLQWFVDIINNSDTNGNGGGSSGSTTLTDYGFVTAGDGTVMGIPDELGIVVREINSAGVKSLRFQLGATREQTDGMLVIEISKLHRPGYYKIIVPIEIKGIYNGAYTHDVAEHKLNNKTAAIEFTPKEIAILDSRIIITENSNITISEIRNNNSAKYLTVTKDKDTGKLVLKPKENGVYKFEVVLIVDQEYCLLTLEFDVINLKNLPTIPQYTRVFKIAIWSAFGLVMLLLVIRIFRWARKKRHYNKEYEKYKMLTKIKKNTADPNHADKEAVVRAKLKMLDPKYAKAYGEARNDKKTTEDKIDAKKKRIEALKNKLDGIEVPEEEGEIKEKQKAKSAAETEAKEKPKAAAEAKETKESKKEAKTRTQEAASAQEIYNSTERELQQELSERDLLEEKIKARLAEEQAEAEARAAAEKAEEERFQSMTKEERKRAEMLKKLKAKYNKK